jgi:hypothetical protein
MWLTLLHCSPTSFQKSGLSFAKVKALSNPSEIVPPSPMHWHVTVHTASTREHGQLSQKSQIRSHVSILMDEQLRVKVNELGPEEDVNGRVAKVISGVDTPV